MYQQYQPQNTGFQNQQIKQNITTEDLREIVQKLNQKPFDENLSLITLDEFTSLGNYYDNILYYLRVA
jgi:hypothetical protein